MSLNFFTAGQKYSIFCIHNLMKENAINNRIYAIYRANNKWIILFSQKMSHLSIEILNT